MEHFFFWLFSALMLLGAAAVILNRDPVSSALCLAVSIAAMAGLFFLLHAFFLGAVQVIVYLGAVMVLFLFIIMLLDLKAERIRRIKPLGMAAGALVGLLFASQLFRVLKASPEWRKPVDSLPPASANDIPAIGALLFDKYVLPFEVIGVLLLVAMVGVVLLSRKETE